MTALQIATVATLVACFVINVFTLRNIRRTMQNIRDTETLLASIEKRNKGRA